MKILVSDPLATEGLDVLQRAEDATVEVRTGLGPEELSKIIGPYDALIIRSGSQVTAEVIDAATSLKVIGRAGIGVDNIDVDAASQKGILVMNTPRGNTITTAEHAIALMMAMTRNIPQAAASMRKGQWKKSRFVGREVFNKTLGVVGLGKIGSIVAQRGGGLKMKVIVHDPFIAPDAAKKQDIELVSFDDLLTRADVVTIHVPKTPQTANLFDKVALAKMKPGAMLINCARGGIVDEEALADAVESEHLSAAAVDVFSTEPPGESRLLKMDRVICTPHLGASTKEAQKNVAVAIAEQILEFLSDGVIRNAVNAPSMSRQTYETLRPCMMLTEKLAAFAAQLTPGAPEKITIRYTGQASSLDTAPLTASALVGLLKPVLAEGVNLVSAPLLARSRGLQVVESKTPQAEDYTSCLEIELTTPESTTTVAGTLLRGDVPKIVRLNQFSFEAVPDDNLVVITNHDRPGVVGRVGTVLGERSVNILRIELSLDEKEAKALFLLSTGAPIDEATLAQLAQLPDVLSAQRVSL